MKKINSFIVSLIIISLVGCTPAAFTESVPTSLPSASATDTAIPPSTVALPSATPRPTNPITPADTVISVETIGDVKRIVTLTGHSGRVFDVAFSPDGAYLASAGQDRKIRLWDTGTWQEVYAFDVHMVELNTLAFSPDGKLLAAGERIWDVQSRQVVHQLDRLGEPSHVAFSPDSSLLAVAGFPSRIKLWDVPSGKAVRTLEMQPDYLGFFSVEFSPAGKQLAAGGADNGSVTLWDVASGKITGTLRHGDYSDVHDLAFSPDGSLLAAGGTGSAVRIWNVDSGEILHLLPLNNGIYGLTFSPDGSILALASCNRVAQLWDVESGQVLRSLPHADELYAVAFSPNGTLLATGGYDNTVVVWGIPH